MFVKNIMISKHDAITVQSGVTLQQALELLEKNEIDALPVLEGDKYRGVVTRYSIYENFFNSNQAKEEFLSSTTVSQIATHQEEYLQGDELFEQTLLALKNFPLLAVVDSNGKFLGILTRSDVISYFESAFGVNRPGLRIAFTSVETEGRIARLSEIAHQFHEHIISLVTFDETDKLVRRIVMKIEKRDNIDKFVKKLEEHGFRILSVKEV